MKVTVFDTHRFDRKALEDSNKGQHELIFVEARLSLQTVPLASGSQAICCFVNDKVNAEALAGLKELGVKLVALRSAGFNQVDIKAASELGLKVVRVPEYSPHAVAEHAVALLLSLNRKIHRAHFRIHELNFSLDGLVGFDLYQKTVGVVGAGRIGRTFANIMRGFGCRVLVYDLNPDLEWLNQIGAKSSSLDELFKQSDILSLHVPLTEDSKHIINSEALKLMKEGAIIINTGRGALIDSRALIQALKERRLGGACLDVYEEEEGVFFSDFSEIGIDDDLLARLLTFPNVLITSHQAFLTKEALKNIADTTISNISKFEQGLSLAGVEVTP